MREGMESVTKERGDAIRFSLVVDNGYTKVCPESQCGIRHGGGRHLVGKDREIQIAKCPVCLKAKQDREAKAAVGRRWR